VITAVLFLIPLIAYPGIRHVPDDYPNIQAAIDAAEDGDTVRIADGIYSGPGNFDIQWDASSKHLVIMSANGRDQCIIDCMGEGRAFFLGSGQDHRDVIEGLTFTGGHGSGSAGGAILIDTTSPRILNCLFTANTTSGDMLDYRGGGAISVNGKARPEIRGNIIRNNFSMSGGGGVSFSDDASGVLEYNIIDSNETQGNGGGIALEYNADPLISNNLVINNFSWGNSGGGIYSHISNPAIVNNTIAFNRTSIEYDPGLGGGIAIEGEPTPLIRNCIIWYNVSDFFAMNIQFPHLQWMDISYSNVENDLDHIFDLKPHTNIDSLPGFVDPENGNFQLLWNSPCINTGTPDTTGLHIPSLDLAGNQRIFRNRVDIGAYEYNWPVSIPSIPEGAYFKVYPNPSAGTMILEIHRDQELDNLVVQICTSGGKVVYVENVHAAQTVVPLNISKLEEGIYFLTLLSGRQVLYRQKIIKN
jgi:parallel beta-helix repeat protein